MVRLAFHCWYHAVVTLSSRVSLLVNNFFCSIFITFEDLIYYICGQLFTGNAISNGNSTKAKTEMASSHFKLDEDPIFRHLLHLREIVSLKNINLVFCTLSSLNKLVFLIG